MGASALGWPAGLARGRRRTNPTARHPTPAGPQSERGTGKPVTGKGLERGSGRSSRRFAMTHPIQAAPADHAPGYKVDISRGQRIGRVSSEWFSRPEDERYLSLNELFDVVRARAEAATARTVETRAIRVEAATDNPERLALVLPDHDAPVAPPPLAFGQNGRSAGRENGCSMRLNP